MIQTNTRGLSPECDRQWAGVTDVEEEGVWRDPFTGAAHNTVRPPNPSDWACLGHDSILIICIHAWHAKDAAELSSKLIPGNERTHCRGSFITL